MNLRPSSLLLAICASAALGACSGDNSPSLTSDAGSKSDSTTTPSTDSSGEAGPTLCQQLGGYTNVKAVVDEAAGVVLADCRINAFFDPAKGGRNTLGVPHIGECLEKYVGAAASCTDPITGAVIRYDKDSKGLVCRDMTVSHEGLGVSHDDFMAFAEDVVKVLDAHAVPRAVKDALVGAIAGTEVQIVESADAGNAKAMCDGGAESGGDGASDAASDG